MLIDENVIVSHRFIFLNAYIEVCLHGGWSLATVLGFVGTDAAREGQGHCRIPSVKRLKKCPHVEFSHGFPEFHLLQLS